MYKLIDENYASGLLIVFIIGFSKLLDSLLGNNNAILFNSDYYRIVLLLGILLAVLTVVLNIIFIPLYGINGAAFATFMAVFIYNVAKIGFVKYKFDMLPFSVNTGKVIMLIIVSIGVFYFWDFSFHAALNIALKTMLISLFYGLTIYGFSFSEDINSIINRVIKR